MELCKKLNGFMEKHSARQFQKCYMFILKCHLHSLLMGLQIEANFLKSIVAQCIETLKNIHTI